MVALIELHIRNFAIIDDLRVALHPGLNVLTGETGAGKSIIIDAIGLLLGDRATGEMIRSGAERAEIEAIFRLEEDAPREASPREAHRNGRESGQGSEPSRNHVVAHILGLLMEEGLDDPDAPYTLILGREVRRSGRNINRVNGRAVSLQILSSIASRLIDIHGQGEHLNLLRPRTHIHLLDRYAGLLAARERLSAQVQRLHQVRRELQRLRQDARTLAQRMDLLSFQVEEILAAQLAPGEEEGLESERRRLGNAETLLQHAREAAALLNEGDGESLSAIDLFGEAVGRLERLARIDRSMLDVAALGQSFLEQMSELVRELQDYADGLEFNPARLAEVEERLDLIHNLKRKYGDTIEDVLAYGAQAQAELEEISDWEVKTAALEAEEDSLLHQIGRLAEELSVARQAAGERMARQVEAELAQLNMAHARFSVALAHLEQEDGAFLSDGRRVAFDATGVDRIEFLISANPGEPLKPMARVASGGETARLMLALKSALADADATPILIFDEIDQGIGGRVGAVVGEKLWRLTGQQGDATVQHQVLCITHLPQLAAFGDRHLSVTKRIFEQEGATRTGTAVRALEKDEQVGELMQMLGAATDAGRRSVEEMLEDVAGVKRAALAA